MAIDSAEKRRSAAGVRRGPRVTPNASPDAEWRAQAGRTYSGISLSSGFTLTLPAFASHGLYQGPRGWYETGDIFGRPYVSATSENAQTFSTATWETINIVQATAHAGFSGSDTDPYGVVDASRERVYFAEDGYYVVQFAIKFTHDATGVRGLKVIVYNASDVAQRTICQSTFLPATTAAEQRFAIISDVEPFGYGWYLVGQVYQSSGGDLTGGPNTLSYWKVANP